MANHFPNCHDCGLDVDEIKEYWYMLFKSVWVEATPDLRARKAMLCIGCVETRLGRPLVHTDFNTIVPCNYMNRRSDRLKERIGMAKREFLMLAHPMKGGEPIGGWYASEKLDGLRAYWDGGITRGMLAASVPFANTAKDARYIAPPKATGLWSRYGKAIQAPDWWLDKLPKIPLDGELWIGRGSFQKVVSITKRIVPAGSGTMEAGWGEVRYKAFDSPPMHAIFANGEIDNTNFKKVFAGVVHKLPVNDYQRPAAWDYRTVLQWLRESTVSNDVFSVHHQDALPYNVEAACGWVTERLETLLQVGGEGLMLRHPTSFWVPQRCRTILKVKGEQDAEGTVIGYVWGRETDKGSKLLGKMGALVLQTREGKRLELSGFTDEERAMVGMLGGADSAFTEGCLQPGEEVSGHIYNPKFPRGSKITYKYREMTDAGIPKEARYWRQHDDHV